MVWTELRVRGTWCAPACVCAMCMPHRSVPVTCCVHASPSGIPLDQVLTFCAAACASTSTLVPHLALSCAIASARQAVAEGGADVGMQVGAVCVH